MSRTNPIPEPNVAVSLEFLKHHHHDSHPTGWAQVVAINLTTHELQIVAWARVTEIDALVPDIERFATDPRWDLYYGVTPRVGNLGPLHGEIGDCLALPCLFNDLDIFGPTHKAKDLPKDEDEVWDKLIRAVELEPTVLVRSGGGLQPLYYIEGGIWEDTESFRRRWEVTWKRISTETGLHIDNTWDVPRILRLPGTLNRKGEPVLVTYEAHRDRMYTLDDLDEVLDPLDEPKRTRSSQRQHDQQNRDRQQDRRRDLHEGERDNGLTSSGGGMRRIAMEQDEILAALLVENQRRCKPPLEEREVKKIARSVIRYDPVEEREVKLASEQHWPQMDEAAFYGLAGEVVRTLAPHTEADPVGLLAEFLALFGNCVGIGPHIRIGAARHPAKLNVNLVGDSARARKDTARVEVARLFSLVDPEWAKQRQVRGLGSGEGLIEKVKDAPTPKDRGPAPLTEEEKHLVTTTVLAASGDSFCEDDGVVIERGWKSMEPDTAVDKRYVVVESEFGRLLIVAERKGSILAPIICMAWDSDVLDITTKKFSAHATNCHISLLGHITVEGLQRQLTKAEAMEGFANRFLYFLVRNSGPLPLGGNLRSEELDALARKVRAAIRRAREVQGPLCWTPEAEALWSEMYIEMSKDDPGGLLGGIVARNQPQTLRLALTNTLATDHPYQIGVEELGAAKAVWDYSRGSAAYIFGDSTGDEVAERIRAELIEIWPERLDQTGLYQLFSNNVAKRKIKLALETLRSMGIIDIIEESTGKRGRRRQVVQLAE